MTGGDTVAARRRSSPLDTVRSRNRLSLARRLMATLALALGPSAPLLAADPPQRPYLRIEAGGHTGAVTALATDSGGRLLATASFDKTIRLWSLPDGRPIATLRPPIGDRQEGELYAVALSPDGNRLLAGGATCGSWDAGFCVYIYDTGKSRLLGLLPNLPAPVNALAVSADGDRFAAGLAQGGVRVLDLHTGAQQFADPGYGGPIRAVAFDATGNLLTTAADGHVRAYDPTGKKTADVQPEPGLHPWALALSPDNGFVAIGFDAADRQGHPRLDVLAAKTLAHAFSPDMAGLHADGILAVAWMADAAGGSRLLAGGYLRDGSNTIVRAWGDFGLGAPTDLAAAGDSIRAILPLPTLGAAFASEDPGWGRIDPGLHVSARPEPPLLNLRPARTTLAIAADGSRIAFDSREGSWTFDTTTAILAQAKRADDLRLPRTEAPGITVTNWQDTDQPSVNGTRLALAHGEFSRALTILPDGAILLGTDNALRLYDKSGHPIASTDTPEPVTAVTAGDGVIAAALLDGTIRWYGPDLAERAALFIHHDGQRWALFTPDGLFDNAPGGGDTLVGVQLNRAHNQSPDWLTFSQAFRALYDPASVRAALRGDQSPSRKRLADLGDLRARLAKQPAIDIASACLVRSDASCTDINVTKPGAKPTLPANATALRLVLKLTDRGLGFGSLDSFVNERNAGRAAQVTQDQTVEIPLDPGQNVVQLRLYDRSGTLFTETPRIELASAQQQTPQTGEPRGRLFILAIGIDHYAAPDLALHFAVADSQSFLQTLKAAADPLYHGVVVLSLTDAQATRLGILAVLDELAHEIKSTDTFLFYIASHGARDESNGRFLLIPADESDLSSWTSIARGAIDEPTLIAALSRIQARDALLFIDTCHSGEMSANTLANLGHETGRYLLAASSPVQEALDSVDDHNGPLVYALKEALSGKAATDPDGTVSALALGEYVSRRVGELARAQGHEQDAQFKTAQSELRSFPIGKVSR